MVEINNFRYAIELGAGFDVWKPCGFVDNHPNFRNGEFIYTSTPISFDSTTNILKTHSGRIYHINSFDGDREKWIKEIETDIEKKGSQLL